MLRAGSIGLAILLTSASWARAQEAIPTAAANPAGGAPVAAAPPAPLGPSAGPDPVRDGPLYGPCGVLRRKADGSVESAAHQGHGEVMAGVGTHGYREAAAEICQPIGDKGSAVTVDVDVGSYGRGR